MANDDKWAWHDTLPEGLDQAKAKAYRQVEQENVAELGGQLWVFQDGQVWHELDGRWMRSIYKPTDLDPPGWVLVEA